MTLQVQSRQPCSVHVPCDTTAARARFYLNDAKDVGVFGLGPENGDIDTLADRLMQVLVRLGGNRCLCSVPIQGPL